MIAGQDADGERTLVVIELKQWGGERTEPVPQKEGIVTTVLGGSLRETTPPSYQAWSYIQLIRHFNVAVRRENIPMHPLSYLHNFDAKYRDRIDNAMYPSYTKRAHIFLKQDIDELSEWLASKITTLDTDKLIQQVEIQISNRIRNCKLLSKEC